MRSHAKASSATSNARGAKGRLGPRTLGPALGFLLLLALLVPILATAANGDYIESFGPDGTSATEFEAPGALAVDQETGAVYLIDGQKQVLYKFDSSGEPLNWGGGAGYLAGNELTGLEATDAPGTNQVAVDSETHVVYVTSNNLVRAFEANGEPHEFTEGPGAGTSEIPGANELLGVATDKYGDIYASDSGDRKIRIYTASGALLNEITPTQADSFAVLQPANLSVSPSGTIYVLRRNDSVFRIDPSQSPITPTTTFGLASRLDEIRAYTVAVDPTTSYVYIGQEVSVPTTSRVAVYDKNGEAVGTLGAPGQPGDLVGNPVGVAVSGSEKLAYVADGVESELLEGPQQVEIFNSFSFIVGPPTVTGTSATEVSLASARLRAKVNPNTLPTTYRFEYGTEDCAVSACTAVPVPDAAIGEGHEPVAVSQEIAGLQPGTTYHYRVVATNSEDATETPDKTFNTELGGLGFELADQRAWEMVSPPRKLGAKLYQFAEGVVQAAADGDGVAYQSAGSIEEDPEGNRAISTSTVLSRRGAGGSWSSEDISPPHREVAPLRLGGEYKLLSSDLGRALLEQQDDTPLSPEASEETPYLRENTDPAKYIPLVTGKEPFANVPPGTVFGGGSGLDRSPVAMGAANSDLTYVALSSNAPLRAGAQTRSLYLWHEGQLEPVSVLPESEGGALVRAQAGSGTLSVRHAVSEDGSRVFWSPGDPLSVSLEWPALYLRDTLAGETVRIDVAEAGAGAGEAHPAFIAASADGSVVFFTDSQHLTEDASPKGRDLYRCEIGDLGGGSLGCTDLKDLSAPLGGSGESGEARELALGVSEDGSRAYFVADAVLDSEANEAGESAVPGANNLYLWQQGQGARFIATLSASDSPNWGRRLTGPTSKIGHGAAVAASASPSGRYLTFMSQRSLSGYESAEAKSFEPTQEVFRYDAQSDSLACVSCNPTGASPEGQLIDPTSQSPPEVDPGSLWGGQLVAATLPEAREGEPTSGFSFFRPRAILDNGRVFFNAIDSLVRADSNGQWDVYQWEPTGVGDCSPSSDGAAIARSAGGCVSLISSGTAEEEASFFDASESGDDAFFLSSAQLSVTDEDEEADVYDARVNGIAATRTPIAECLGEACQSAPNPPNDPTPASAAFHGAGNVPSERCPESKRKVLRAGSPRCVAKKHKHKRSHKAKKRAANNRRAGR